MGVFVKTKPQLMKQLRLQGAAHGRDLAEETVSIAKTICPVGKIRGGTLSRSIEWEDEGDAQRVYTETGYGGWVELGTSKMEGRFFILRAFQQALENLAR